MKIPFRPNLLRMICTDSDYLYIAFIELFTELFPSP